MKIGNFNKNKYEKYNTILFNNEAIIYTKIQPQSLEENAIL